MTRIVALCGEPEYESDVTMRPVCERIADKVGADLDYRVPDVLEDVPNFPTSSFGDLDVLAESELLVLFTRFRVLPENEMQAIARYLERGGAILALRTANHAFHPVNGSPWSTWASNFAQKYLGSAWSTHHGHSSHTAVTVIADHPVTEGLPERFEASSWLYVNDPPADATRLLWGEPIASEHESLPSPVAWVRERGAQRVFYTCLGGQSDLRQPEILTLVDNAAAWCLRL